jgi:hypothetical protein
MLFPLHLNLTYPTYRALSREAQGGKFEKTLDNSPQKILDYWIIKYAFIDLIR